MPIPSRPRINRSTNTAVCCLAALLVAGGVASPAAGTPDAPGDVLFRESFDDPRLPGRGWYDGRTFAIVAEGARAGEGCIAYHWKPDTTTPERSSALRRLVRADGDGLSALLPQALARLGLDRPVVSPSPDPAPDHRGRPVPRPGREPPDGLRRAAGGQACAWRPRTFPTGTRPTA